MTPVGVPDPAEVEAQPSEPSAADVEELAAVMTDADCSSSEYPFSDESRARAILTSDWLADHNRARDRELGERIATAIEADRYVGASRNTYGQGYYDGHADARAEAARIARAESERARQHTGTGGE